MPARFIKFTNGLGSPSKAVVNGGNSKLSKIVNITKTAATTKALISISPNPASDFVTINFSVELTEAMVIITDANGKVVLKTNFSGTDTTINTNMLAAGIYNVNITTNDASQSQKLSVVR